MPPAGLLWELQVLMSKVPAKHLLPKNHPQCSATSSHGKESKKSAQTLIVPLLRPLEFSIREHFHKFHFNVEKTHFWLHFQFS